MKTSQGEKRILNKRLHIKEKKEAMPSAEFW